MTKVQCKICGDIGYTASPKHAICECGGRLKIIQENNQKEKVESRFNFMFPPATEGFKQA